MISVIITTHNRESRILERALYSCVNQTIKNKEIIIIDDSSNNYIGKDKTKVLCKKYKNVRYIETKGDCGACISRNIGIKNAKGEFIAFLDDDDEWLSTKLEKQLSLFTNDDIGMVYCGFYVCNDDTKKIQEFNMPKLPEGEIYNELLFYNYIGSTSLPLIRKNLLEKVGGFDPSMSSAQDYDLWIRLSQITKIVAVKESLVKYHIHNGEQITKNIHKRIAGLERIITKNYEAYMKNTDSYWNKLIGMAPIYAEAGQYRKSFKTLKKCISIYPYKIKANTIALAYIIKHIIFPKRTMRR